MFNFRSCFTRAQNLPTPVEISLYYTRHTGIEEVVDLEAEGVDDEQIVKLIKF